MTLKSLSHTSQTAIAATAILLALGSTAQAQQCPDFQLYGSSLSYTADDLWTPRSHNVTAGGGLDLSRCNSVPGIGYVGVGPDFTINYTAGQGRSLSIKAVSNCDTIILVNYPNASWEYDDDSAGNLDPMVWIDNAASGIYDVWVGTIDDDLCPATLTLETFQ